MEDQPIIALLYDFDNTLSTEDMQELLRLVRSISNNVNQIAVRVNSTDKVYREDMDNIKDGVEKIWQQLRYFQSQLRSVQQ